jgi:hypothetical protein
MRRFALVALMVSAAFSGSAVATKVMGGTPARAGQAAVAWQCKAIGSVYSGNRICGYGLRDPMQPQWKCVKGSANVGGQRVGRSTHAESLTSGTEAPCGPSGLVWG